jgi:hypothetical protein
MDAISNSLPLQCEAVARAALGEPAKRAGDMPEPKEAYWPCPQHADMKGGVPRTASLKINSQKNTWMCGPCGASGNAWELTAFLLGRGWRWESLGGADKSALTAWLRERGLLTEKPPSRKAVKKIYPVLREFIYRNADGDPVARRTRHDAPSDEPGERFRWWHLENKEWKPGLQRVNELPLYIGLPAAPAPRDKNAYLSRLDVIENSTQIILCEGEHDADAGAQIGLPTVSSGGTSSLAILQRNEDSFSDQDVVILAHPGPKELEFAERAAATLHGGANRITIVKLQDALPEAGIKDLADVVEVRYKDMPAKDLRQALERFFTEAREWCPPGGAEVLDAVYNFIRRFISLSEPQARVATLWAAHTHAIDAAEFTPYLAITSPEKRCGKSRLLRILWHFVRNPWKSGSASAAVLAHKIDSEQPTLLLDESDATFNGPSEYSELLRGVLNNGFEREGGTYDRMEGQGASQKPVSLRVFCPKAIAGIGRLPDTVTDRSIPIRMQRALQGQIERLRGRDAKKVAGPIAARLGAWCAANERTLREARLPIIEELNDRQNDFAEPLVAIADLAGGDWPEAARRAIIELCAQAQAEDDSLSTLLLHDIKAILDGSNLDRITSEDLATSLAAMEDRPWAEMPGSHKAVTKAEIARLLRRHSIKPANIRRDGGEQRKGYRREWFIEAWEHYPPPPDASRSSIPTCEDSREVGPFESALDASEPVSSAVPQRPAERRWDRPGTAGGTGYRRDFTQ